MLKTETKKSYSNKVLKLFQTVLFIYFFYLDISFIHFHEVVFYAIFIFDIMKHQKPHPASCYKCRDKPFIELVNYF